MDEHHDENISNTEPSCSREPTKKTRGPTTCKKLKEKFAHNKLEMVEFDEYGNPIGKSSYEFKSYIGSVVRVQVDINIENWNLVSEGLKDTIWADIKERWNLKDDVQKKQTLATAGKIWRDFKSRLVNRYLRKGIDPREKYDYLTDEHWEKFKMTRESEEFKLKSDKARENQKLNKHPHYLGKGGYAAKRPKWVIDDPISSLSMSESIDASTISDDRSGRSYDWVRARVKEKKDGGYYIPTQHTKEVFEKMGEWQGKALEGSWSPHGHDDILTRALGNKEHGGRVRGVGGRARIKDVFGSENSTQSRVVCLDDLTTFKKELEAKVRDEVKKEYKEEMAAMINLKLRGILDHFKQMGMPVPDNFEDEVAAPTKDVIRSSCPDNFEDDVTSYLLS